MANAFTNTGPLPGSTTYTSGLNQTPTLGISQPSSGLISSAPISAGNNTGMLPSNTHTTSTSSSGATSTKPTPNPSVLSQQQALNKIIAQSGGTPLVEDGLAGPKTQAALAQYGSQLYGGSSSSTSIPTPSSQPTTSPTTSSGVYTPQNQGQNGVSQGGLISNLVTQSQQPSQAYTDAQNAANAILAQKTALAQDYAQKTNNIANTAGFLTQQNGEQGLLQQQYNTGQDALSQQYQGATNQLNAANTQQGLQVQAGTNAANANAPITGVPYGTQTINPATGQLYSSNGSVSIDPNNPQSSIPSLAQAVMNGQMTIDQANSALGGNLGLTTQLRNSILQSNPSFNFVQSSSSSSTQATGQQLKASVDTANKALDTLSTSFNSLPGVQTGGIPLSNSIAQWIGTQFGQSALQAYKTNLADARAQLVGVLNTSGGTPTGNENTALQYLPDNMTLAQFNSNVGTQQNPGIVRQLMSQKLGSFSGSGSQNSSGSISWDTL